MTLDRRRILPYAKRRVLASGILKWDSPHLLVGLMGRRPGIESSDRQSSTKYKQHIFRWFV